MHSSRLFVRILLALNSVHIHASETPGCFGPLAHLSTTSQTLPASPTAQSILNNLPAVHATSRFPLDGRILAGREGTEGDASTRVTLTTHFALGAMVPQNETANWDDTSKYAIVFPFRHIAKESINFLAQDTAALGDVRVPSDAVIVVAHNAPVPAGSPYEIQRCAPNQKLSSKVAQVIEEKKYWKTKLLTDSGFSGDFAEAGGRNINDPVFTANLRNLYPNLRLESPTQHPAHQLDIYFSRFVTEVFSLHGLVTTVRGKGIQDGAKIVRLNIQNLKAFLSSQKLDTEQEKLVRTRLQEIEDWLHLIDIEVMLQEKFGATLSRSDHKNDLFQMRSDHAKVDGYIQKVVIKPDELEKLKLSHVSNPPAKANPTTLAYMTQHLPIDEFGKLFDSLSRDGWGKEIGIFKATYVIQRLTRTDVGASEIDKLLNLFDETFRVLPPSEQDLVAGLMFKWPLRKYMDAPRSPELIKRFEKLVNLPHCVEPFRKTFKRPFLNDYIQAPDAGPLVFQQMVRIRERMDR
jgi:hypothetical protein